MTCPTQDAAAPAGPNVAANGCFAFPVERLLLRLDQARAQRATRRPPPLVRWAVTLQLNSDRHRTSFNARNQEKERAAQLPRRPAAHDPLVMRAAANARRDRSRPETEEKSRLSFAEGAGFEVVIA